MPRSSDLASSCVTHTPSRSPCVAACGVGVAARLRRWRQAGPHPRVAVSLRRPPHGLARRADLHPGHRFRRSACLGRPSPVQAREDGAGEHRALPLDWEAVINREVHRTVGPSLGQLDPRLELLDEILDTDRISPARLVVRRRLGAPRPGGHSDHRRIGKLCCGERLADPRLHLLEFVGARSLGQHVELVEHHDERVVKDLTDDQALGCLSLDALGHVDDEQHHVNDLCAADDGPDERRVARAVDEGDLHLVERTVVELGGETRDEGGEAEVERDASLFALRIFVKGVCRRHCRERSREARLARIHVAEDANVDIESASPESGGRRGLCWWVVRRHLQPERAHARRAPPPPKSGFIHMKKILKQTQLSRV
eukprot:scaffold12693_cov142-Isochrysis_galbana.AAC.8